MKYKMIIVAFLFGISNIVSAQLNPLSIGTIHPNDSIVVIYDVTINTLPAGVIKIGNQGTLTGGNFASTVTDDPDTGTPLDTTFTPVYNPVPVTLLDFSVLKQSGTVVAKWSTAQEINSDKFEIQHSTDGRNFVTIGTVQAKGFSNIITDYTFTHSNPVTGWNYYRLKQIDKDRRFVITYVRSIKFDSRDIQELYVYPNPVIHHIINLQMNKVEKGNYTLRLSNALGQVVFTKTILYDGSPVAPINLPASLGKGVYDLQLMNNSIKLNKRIVVE